MAILKENKGFGHGRIMSLQYEANKVYLKQKGAFVVPKWGGAGVVIEYEDDVRSGSSSSGTEFDLGVKVIAEETKSKMCTRFKELLRLQYFRRVILDSRLNIRFIHLEMEDHDEIFRMFEQEYSCFGHQSSGFTAEVRDGAGLTGRLIGEGDQFWKFSFCNALLEKPDGTKRMPHVSMLLEEGLVSSTEQSHMLARYAVKALLSYQVLFECL